MAEPRGCVPERLHLFPVEVCRGRPYRYSPNFSFLISCYYDHGIFFTSLKAQKLLHGKNQGKNNDRIHQGVTVSRVMLSVRELLLN